MKNTLKKALFSLWTIGLIWAGSLWMVNAQSLLWWVLTDVWDAWNDEDYVWQNMSYNPWNSSNKLAEDNIIYTIKNFINRVLWLLSLIALAICLWWGFQMLTASGDETKYKKGFTILKQAGFGLAIIALAWLIVSVVFRIVNKTASSWTAWATPASWWE